MKFPNYIMIQTISGCNARCEFCPYPYIKEQLPYEKMNWDIFADIIDECSRHKNIRVIMPYLMNEPLLDKELPEKITYIKKRVPWAKVHILTNGSLLDQDFALGLIKSGIDWIGFSFHGISPQTVEEVMGINYHLTLNNILNFIELSKSFKKNISEYIMITFIQHQRLSQQEREQAFKFWTQKGITRISFYSSPISRAGNVPVLPSVRNEKIYGCNSIWTEEMFHILADGSVVLCCMDWKKEMVLGNVKQNSIEQIWNSKLYRETWDQIRGRKQPHPNLICLRCECAKTRLDTLENKILLVLPPPWGYETPPVGLGVISQVLEESGYEVEVLDLNILLYSRVFPEDKVYWEMDKSLYWKEPEFLKSLRDKYSEIFQELEDKLKKDNSKIVGFSVPTSCMYPILEWAVNILKSQHPERYIIVGGASVSIEEQREELLLRLEDKIDVIVIGEGEATIKNLVTKIFSNKSINDIPNALILRDGNRILSKVSPLPDLDFYPFPKYRKFPLHLYTTRESLAVEWSRGCIGKCKFCDFRGISNFYKKKSPDRIIEELEYYSSTMGKRHFSVVNSSVNADVKWLEKICEKIIKKNLEIQLTGFAIPKSDTSYKLLKKMKKAGFYRLEYVVESGSDKVLKAMGKYFNFREASQVLKDTKKVGIKNVVYFIVGYPGEEEDFQKTLQFIRENKQYIDLIKSVNPLYLMAGSELYRQRKNYNISLPSDNPDIYWYVKDKNTFELRMERVRKVQDLLKKLNIPYTTEASALPEKDVKRKTNIKRKADVVLVTTPPWGVNNPPVGLAYLASYLRAYGYQPQVFDFNIQFYHKGGSELQHLWHVENKNFWKDKKWFGLIREIFQTEIEEGVEKILATSAPIIGFSVVDPKENITIEFIKRIKEKDKNKKIILGGPACLTSHARKIFIDEIGDLIDYFVPGEGEEVLLDIVKNNCRGEIEGTIFKVNDSWKYLPRAQIKNLDQIPFPSYEDFDLKLYPGNSLILEWSRGCIGQCAFCINYKFVKGYRWRSSEHIFQELKYHAEINNIRKFTICDPIINGNPKQLDKLCDLILKDGLEISWTGEAIPRKDMSLQLLQKMKKAGCHKLQIGVESGSAKVLKNMRKLYTPEIAEQFLRKVYQAGMETEVFIMIGFPGEGEKEFQETVEFIKRNSNYIDTIKSINTLHLIAGADVYEQREKFGIKPLPPENWHYLWETEDGNNYELRRKRGEYLLELARKLGIKVMETNLHEGKHLQQEEVNYHRLKMLVNNLQDLPERRKLPPILPRKRWIKLPYLTLILGLTLIAEVYLWILKKLRRMIIFPGS
jgi:radical SAM superfamily enzyme YgiQ (UPF0313 family)